MTWIRSFGETIRALDTQGVKIDEEGVFKLCGKDREGDARAAYDYWSQARSRGARGGKLDEWIDSKTRLFGF